MTEEQIDIAAVLSSVLPALDMEVAIFDSRGRELYSCIEDGDHAAAVERYARDRLPASENGGRTVLSCGGEQMLLRIRRVEDGGETISVFAIAPHETFAERTGIDYKDADGVQRDYDASVMGIVEGYGDLSPRLREAYERGATIMLEGEAGTAKTQLAELLYLQGDYAQEPFVHVSCEALSDKTWRYLVSGTDSPLFQNGLTLYISGLHILTLPKVRQLVTVMHESAVCRRNRVLLAGDDAPGAGESDAVARIAEALHCAVCVATPVREMRDNAVRVETYISYLARALEVETPQLDSDARAALEHYAWPRNYVQLREVAERLFIVAAGGAIDASTVDEVLKQERVVRHAVAGPSNMEGDLYVLRPLAETDRAIASLVLDYLGGNKTKAAEVLGISRTTLWRLLKESSTAHGVE